MALQVKGYENGTKAPGPAREGKGRLITAAIILLVSAFIIYSKVISAPFVLDDEVNIIRNLRLHDLSNFWPPAGSRYLGYLSFALNFRLGGLDTTGYHLVNIIIHIINGVLVYSLVLSIFKTPRIAEWSRGLKTNPAPAIALISSIIFIAHPINTQAVNYITQRFTTLAALFYLLSIVVYLKWRGSAGKKSAGLYILSLGAAIAAQKTKEISFTLPFMIVFFEFVFFKGSGPLKKRFNRLVPFLLTLVIIPLSIFGPELGLWSSGIVVDDRFTRVQQVIDIKELSPYRYLITQFRVIVTYLRLILVPVNQNLDYEYTRYTSFWTPGVVLSFLLLSSILITSAWLFLMAWVKKNPFLLLISSGVFWFFITIAVDSSVIPIRDVIFEHRVYLPGIGLFIAFATALVYAFLRLRERGALKTTLKGATVIIILFTALPLGIFSYRRNIVWSDIVTLYEDIAAKSPGNARARNNLGVQYAMRGMTKKAVKEFRAALGLKSDYPGPHKNLARALYSSGEVEEAIKEYKLALALTPADPEIHENLAQLYYKKGLLRDAEREYKLVLQVRPGNVNVRNNLANILTLEGKLNEAVNVYKSVISLKPGQVEAYYNLGLALEKSGRVDEAVRYYRRFAELAPPSYDTVRENALERVRLLTLEKR
ncbi:MAG: tetratricopeptide repeat protein [Thermodesulfobacteriota bacterium]|nr:MAG: tetratricopeptide repeat protein [Thermodesulfobacteriota bacterium]